MNDDPEGLNLIYADLHAAILGCETPSTGPQQTCDP